MGGGSWTRDAFKTYTTTSYTSRGINVIYDASGTITSSLSNQQMFTARRIHSDLDPMGVMRECRDTEEHPNTIPIILALDTTGSLGQVGVKIAKKLNVIMTDLYDKIKDIEFCIMGIGDLYCDDSPIQISQFESDVRIAEHLDKLWFEFGGGGNSYESYTAAWYMGTRHCDLDCWKRGEKGIIITIGDERVNPYLQKNELQNLTGDNLQSDIDTKYLYKEALDKFDIYHIQVNHDRNWDIDNIRKSWDFLGENYKEANLDNITDTIVDIIVTARTNATNTAANPIISDINYTPDGIAW